jgi:rRNA maturation RNase YbeY
LTDIEIFNESGLEVPVTVEEFTSLASEITKGEKKNISWLELVYVDEDGIIEVNKRFLGKSYVTDVITFSYTDDNLSITDIEGTIYMCNQRIREQSSELNTSEVEEFKRIFVHGVLHLCGYNDETPELKLQMTQLENKYLS